MITHLSNEEINAVVQYNLGHTEYFILSESNRARINSHLNDCLFCKDQYMQSKAEFEHILQKKSNLTSKKYIYAAASIVVLLSLLLTIPSGNNSDTTYATNIHKNVEFEELLSNPLRATGLELLSPLTNGKYKSMLNFKLNYSGPYSELSLRIFDHTEKTVFSKNKLEASFQISPNIKNGYYYIVIESPKEALVYSSFYWEK